MSQPAQKPFPWKCGKCRERTVVLDRVAYTTEIEHDGRAHTVTIPDLELPRCGKCGMMIRDDAANRRISAALREQLGLLSPEAIRSHREALGLTQKAMAGQLGIAEATLSRWETGAQIQQRAMDRLLQLFFRLPKVRGMLALHTLESDETLADLMSRSTREHQASRGPSYLAPLEEAFQEVPLERRQAVADSLLQLFRSMLSSPARSGAPAPRGKAAARKQERG